MYVTVKTSLLSNPTLTVLLVISHGNLPFPVTAAVLTFDEKVIIHRVKATVSLLGCQSHLPILLLSCKLLPWSSLIRKQSLQPDVIILLTGL